MKITRLYPTSKSETPEDINTCLDQTYVNKGNFDEIIGKYERTRIKQDGENYRINSTVKGIIDNTNKEISWDLFLNFIIGVKEVAYYLAMSFIEGYGVIKNNFLADLTIAIGVKLGDENSGKLAETRPISAVIQKISGECMKQILQNAYEVANGKVSWEEIMGKAKFFDQMVIQLSGHSYWKQIETLPAGMKVWGEYIQVEEDSVDLEGEAKQSNSDCCVLL